MQNSENARFPEPGLSVSRQKRFCGCIHASSRGVVLVFGVGTEVPGIHWRRTSCARGAEFHCTAFLASRGNAGLDFAV